MKIGIIPLSLAFLLLSGVPSSFARQEAAPQVNISGTGVGSLGYGKTAEQDHSKARLNFSDTSLQLGASQLLYSNAGVGSFGLGALSTEDTNRGSGNSLFLHQAFVDYQTEPFEASLGRTNNPAARLVDFPTLRSDDLNTLIGPQNPFSNGGNSEEHRFANVGSVIFNQGLRYFENIHVQHLIDSAGAGSDTAINSFGTSFSFLGEPGMESLEALPSWGFGFEQITRLPGASSGIHQVYAGALININKSTTNRLELGLLENLNWGSDLRSFTNITDTFRADANAFGASLRYLHSPYGAAPCHLALTAGHKKYLRISGASSWGLALTATKRLGPGFDLAAQYQGQWRSSALAAAQSHGTSFENVGEIGLIFSFDATFNEHISLRRSLLNQRHGYIRD